MQQAVQVIGKDEKRGWLGNAGYRLVRKLRWGDLWPLPYQLQANTQPSSQHQSQIKGGKTLVVED